MNFPYRYVARIVVEAETPLAVGSDSLKYDLDKPVEKDFNDLPFIPGTAIAGYLRKKVADNIDALFGDKPEEYKEQPTGSNIIVSDAFLMDSKGKVHQQPEIINDDFLNRYFKLPVRQHTAINEYGAAKEHSKFDTEIVYKGSRFKFEIELQLAKKKDDDWKEILNTFFRNDFYLGSGEYNNFGELKVFEIKQRRFNLNEDLDAYLKHDVNLNEIGVGFQDYKQENTEVTQPYQENEIKFSGKNSFFHFGAGYGDTLVDNVNYTEDVAEGWDAGGPKFEEYYVIPGTSIKGALAHRVAFHYNKEKGNTVEELIPKFKEKINEICNDDALKNLTLAETEEELKKQKAELEKRLKNIQIIKANPTAVFENYLGENNEAVKTLFGTAKQSEKEKEPSGQSGQIIFKDIYLKKKDFKEHIFYHNKIDRYTGGTIETALFSEKVLIIDERDLCYKYKDGINLEFLNKAIDDLKNGMLPLGGLVNKGHGIFTELKTNENGN